MNDYGVIVHYDIFVTAACRLSTLEAASRLIKHCSLFPEYCISDVAEEQKKTRLRCE